MAYPSIGYRSVACVRTRRVITRLILCSVICPGSQAFAVAPAPTAPQEAGERPVVQIHASENSGDLSLRTARLKNAALEWSVLEAVFVDIIDRNAALSPDGGRSETIVFATARPSKLVSASGLIDRD
jgi:hypothetical protein